MTRGTSQNKGLVIRLREVMYSCYLLRPSLLTKVGIAISGTVMVLALLAPVVAPYSPTTPNFAVKLQPPTFAHVLGTDQFGFDIFSRILFAYRLDLEIAFAVVILGVTFGVLLGAFAGYTGGKTDEALMRVTDIFFSVPSLILALAVAAVLGRTFNGLVTALAIPWWPSYATPTRGEALTQEGRWHVDAATAAGAGRRGSGPRRGLANAL